MTKETLKKAVELNKQRDELVKLIDSLEHKPKDCNVLYGSGGDVIALNSADFPTVDEIIKDGLYKKLQKIDEDIRRL